MTEQNTNNDKRKKRRLAILWLALAADYRRTASAAAVLLMATTGIAGLVSSALLVDSDTVDNNTFAIGTIDLTVNPTTTRFTVTGMMPGDVYTAPLTVGNAGSAALRYAMLSTTTENPLAAQLQMTIRVASGTSTTGCDNAGFGTFGAALSPAYTNGVLGTTGGTKVIGDAAQGDDTGDRVLAGAASEVLCVQVTLPSSVTAPAAASTSADFLFNAEQTANNP